MKFVLERNFCQMTRSEKLILERVLFELETEMKKVQDEIDELRRALKSKGIRRRGRANDRMCVRSVRSRRS
jgi:hypothetical protein